VPALLIPVTIGVNLYTAAQHGGAVVISSLTMAFQQAHHFDASQSIFNVPGRDIITINQSAACEVFHPNGVFEF
jgi:hypothetical protein